MKIKLVLCIIACMCAGVVEAVQVLIKDSCRDQVYVVQVNEDYTIGDIKEQISMKYNISTHINIVLASRIRQDNEMMAPLIKEGEVPVLFCRVAQAFIKDYHWGRVYTVGVDEDTTVAGIKKQINEKYGVSTEGRRIMISGIHKKDDEKIASLIKAAEVVWLA